ncbi:MAG TPA: hypothetical protein VGN20_07520 [Mucilaginibacter sp.]|jgi:drug/metabolite transporter (DMT)-like permease
MERKLIHSSHGKISVLQIIGFVVIFFGLVYLFIQQITNKLNGETIAIDFFTIMLGIAFAFPELLRDSNKGLSTMRIIVFMIINVICLLLLKIGWDEHSLKEIGVDQWWVSIIGFVFGAKATQSYFESKVTTNQAALTAAKQVLTTAPPPALLQELDGCGVTPTKLTTDADLPVSKGGTK